MVDGGTHTGVPFVDGGALTGVPLVDGVLALMGISLVNGVLAEGICSALSSFLLRGLLLQTTLAKKLRAAIDWRCPNVLRQILQEYRNHGTTLPHLPPPVAREVFNEALNEGPEESFIEDGGLWPR